MDLQTQVWTVLSSSLPPVQPRKTWLIDVLHVQAVSTVVELKVGPLASRHVFNVRFTGYKAYPVPFLCDLGHGCEGFLHLGHLERNAGVQAVLCLEVDLLLSDVGHPVPIGCDICNPSLRSHGRLGLYLGHEAFRPHRFSCARVHGDLPARPLLFHWAEIRLILIIQCLEPVGNMQPWREHLFFVHAPDFEPADIFLNLPDVCLPVIRLVLRLGPAITRSVTLLPAVGAESIPLFFAFPPCCRRPCLLLFLPFLHLSLSPWLGRV